MPSFWIFAHPACLGHNPIRANGLAPARLRAAIDGLRGPLFSRLGWSSASSLPMDYLTLAHTPDYIQSILRPIPDGAEIDYDADTQAMSGTAQAALVSAGLIIQATQAVAAGAINKAFCLVSPGGHHAEADTAQGFCFFNHIAIAAIAAQTYWQKPKVAVIDFDAHHGNGTQSLFWNNADRLLISLHEDNDMTGLSGETGAFDNILNIPLPRKSDGAGFRAAFTAHVPEKLRTFQPDLLLVSSGFDMHRDDPLSSMQLEVEDYLWLGQQLRALADELTEGRLVSVLEGGYNLTALAECVAAYTHGLLPS